MNCISWNELIIIVNWNYIRCIFFNVIFWGFCVSLDKYFFLKNDWYVILQVSFGNVI